jgi:act minimal PKS acyl carrier protein
MTLPEVNPGRVLGNSGEAEQFGLEDLKRILLESAGADETVDLDGDILDRDFDELGYESLALLETGRLVERSLGITLPDAVLTDSGTPRALIAAINEHIAAAGLPA